jgi:predicted TIM-barrel fold metal-dependent hydrolase
MALGAQSYRIIDPHVHVWKADPRFPWAEGQKPPAKDATPEMLLALMKANGVARTVIIQVIHYRFDNSYLASVLKQYPREFRGVARVNPEDPAAPDHLSKLVQEQGFRGVRLSPNATAAGDWIRGPLMPPLWKRCSDLKVPMTILAPIVRMPDVSNLAEKFPDLTIVIDHMADCPVDKPEELEKLIALRRHPKLFVKISHAWSLSKQPYPWLDAQEHVKRLYHAFGPQRLMWGTDWPVSESHTTYDKTLTLVRDDMKFLSADDKSWILSRTIERVWPFDS